MHYFDVGLEAYLAISVASSIVSPGVVTLGNSGTETLKPPSGFGCSTISYSRSMLML